MSDKDKTNDKEIDENEYQSALDLEEEYKKELRRKALEQERARKIRDAEMERIALENERAQKAEYNKEMQRRTLERKAAEKDKAGQRPERRARSLTTYNEKEHKANHELAETRRLVKAMRTSLRDEMQAFRRRSRDLDADKRLLEFKQIKLEWDRKNKHQKGNYEQYGFFDKPPKRVFFDKKEKTICGRSFKKWMISLVFYLCFYAILAAIFAISLQVFLGLIQPKGEPLDSRYIMPQPGLSIFPADAYGLSLGPKLNRTIDKQRVDDAMGTNKLRLTPNTGTVFEWDRNKVCFMNRLEYMFKRYLRPYKNRSHLVNLGNCNKQNLYGYRDNQPCFFLKINRIHKFKFKTYRKYKHIPLDFPLKLRELITAEMKESDMRGKVFIDCGPVPRSRYSLGDIAYWPKYQTVDVTKYYFNKSNPISDDNLMPLVTIQLLKPKLWTNLGLVCKMWARNIDINDDDSRYYMGASKIYFNIKDSKSKVKGENQSNWEILEFPH